MKKAQPTDQGGEIDEQAAPEAESATTPEPEEASAEQDEGTEEPLAEGDEAAQPLLPHVLPDPTERRSLLEAIVYVAEEPLTPEQIAEGLGLPAEVLAQDLDQLAAETQAAARGVEIRKVAGGYKMFTKAEHHEAIRGFVKTLRPKLRLSLPALETLAVVAYKQPVTVPEIQAIRGVNAGGVIHTLLNHKLITTAGRKKVIGRPMQYKTTKEFLIQFGLNDLTELPNLKELEELSRAAMGEGEEPETSQAQASEGSEASEDQASENQASENGAGGDALEASEESRDERAFDDSEDNASVSEDLGNLSARAAAAGGGSPVVSQVPDEDSEEESET